MKRTLLTWTIFAAALVLVLGVMSFFTWRMLQFERAVALADAKAGMEETIRLALWRMDAAAPVLLAPEAIIERNAAAAGPPGARRIIGPSRLRKAATPRNSGWIRPTRTN